MLAWLKCWKFPCLLAFGLILVQALLAYFLFHQAGSDRVWLGDYLWNSADQAVYLGYIEQAKAGALLFHNWYAPVDAASFLHPLYVPIGWLAAIFRLSPIGAHELGRWVVTIISVCLLYRVAQTSTSTERDARIATLTIVLGGGLGWIAVVHQGMTGILPVDFTAPADVSSETFFFPTIIAGAHIMLSLALLIYSLKQLWIDIDEKSHSHWRSITSITALFFIHPYFVPLIGLYGLILLCVKRLPWRELLRLAYLYGPFLIIAIASYAWSQWHDPYRRFFIEANHLPLGSLTTNILSFLPWLGFIIWRLKKNPIKKDEYWILAWIVVALILIAIPAVHFKRKMLEGLGVGIILLSFPVWQQVLAWAKRTGKIAYAGMWIMILLSPLSLIQSQIAWVTRPMGRGDEFYVSQDLAKAWQWLQTTSPTDALILPDDVWVGVWTAPNAKRHVWVGHDHETPDWVNKKTFLQNLWQQQDAKRVQIMLNETAANIVLTTRTDSESIMRTKTDGAWQTQAVFGSVEIWSKK